jgi:regulator of RNase E activity RraB
MGQPPLAILIGELCTIEAKVDALMHLLEDKSNVNYKMFGVYVEQVCNAGAENNIKIREAMLSKKPAGPVIVKP